MSEKLEHQNLNDRAYADLKGGLISGTFFPGQVFVIRALAERYGISTTPVREALQRLVAERLLVMKPNRSIVVPSLSPAKFMELYRIRCELEGLAGELATAQFRAVDVGRLNKVLDAIDRAVRRQDKSEYRRLNKGFHFAIYEKANAPHLLEMIQSLWGQVGPVFNGLFEDPGYGAHANTHHREIVLALEEHDAKGVRASLAEDITAAAKTLVPLLRPLVAKGADAKLPLAAADQPATDDNAQPKVDPAPGLARPRTSGKRAPLATAQRR